MKQQPTRDAARGQKARAYAVHVLTASGVVFAFLAAAEVAGAQPDARWVFVWLLVAGVIDAVDGPLARRWEVGRYAPNISGRTIDDIVDYLTFTFIPLLLVWRMDWLPGSGALFVAGAMGVSLLGFANAGAKQEAEGFFLGFPSYWNVVAFYVGLWAAPAYAPAGPVVSAALVVLLAALTVLPVRFIYPNQAPRPWKGAVVYGAAAWLALLLFMLFYYPYPQAPVGVMLLSCVYPLFYLGLSAVLDWKSRLGGA